MVAVAVYGDNGQDNGGGDDENDRNGGNSEGSSRNGVNCEVGQIMGTDGEGMMSDNDGTGVEATAEGF
jgi:hypothetical protein